MPERPALEEQGPCGAITPLQLLLGSIAGVQLAAAR